MRSQGQYADAGGHAYVGAQVQHISSQRMEHISDPFQERLEAFTPEREQPYATKMEGQLRWERDELKLSNPVASQRFNEDPRSRLRQEDMQIGVEDKPLSQTFEVIEQKFLDDIIKLAKEQDDAEDAENARHREKINSINAWYQEQVGSLRKRHASHRDELLRKESYARQHQYQQAKMENYPNSSTTLSDPHGFNRNAVSAAVNEAHRGYNTDHVESYGDQAQFHGSASDLGYDPRGSYHSGRVYNTGPRYYQ